MGKFEETYSINVNDKIEKKGNLNYLSWSWAWAEFKKLYPKATYTVDRFDGTYCTGNESIGYMVRTEVFADDLSYEMWLPVMDSRNNTILKPKMTEINKTIMRCLTKNLAMFGLGLYIYAGEDLPEVEQDKLDADAAVKPIRQTTQNKPEKAPKKDDKPKDFEPITKSELVGIWGVETPEKTIAWLEGKVGKELANFNEEETAWARDCLAVGKEKREAAAKRKAAMERMGDEDIPFPMGDE